MSAEISVPTSRLRVSSAGLRSAFGNACLGLVFALFAWAHFKNFADTLRLSVLLIVVKEGLDAFFYLTRRPPESFSTSPYEWVTALTGTFVPMLFRPTDGAADLLFAQVLLFAGLALQSLGMLSLKRSIGMVPANRGIVSTGLYRFVRHPLYSAYALTFVGYLLNHASFYNALIFAAWVGLQLLRIFNEERFLARDPAYRAFMQKTRWRVIPYVL
jgi:protein-S-isoprenylcysteine O-methyltransferase Ste14